MKKMRFFIKVKTRAKENKIEKIGDNRFGVWVKELPVEGKANEAVLRAMAKYFGTSVSMVKIVSGRASRQKIIEIL